jgi:hypothetical protein
MIFGSSTVETVSGLSQRLFVASPIISLQTGLARIQSTVNPKKYINHLLSLGIHAKVGLGLLDYGVRQTGLITYYTFSSSRLKPSARDGGFSSFCRDSAS